MDSRLAVVYLPADAQAISAELRKIDPELFLDPEWSPEYKALFYTVKFWNGERAPHPVTVVVDWRDKNGRPRELTHGIVDEVKRIGSQGGVSIREVIKKNEELVARRDDMSYLNYEEAAKESIEWLKRKPIFHRSPAFAAARRRTRRNPRGEWG